MTAKQYDVVVTGAGPVGLALATELTSRGRTVCVIEQNEQIGKETRSKIADVRTMAHLRRWGLSGLMRWQSPFTTDFPRRVRYSTRLFGKDIYFFDNAFCLSPIRDDRFPERADFIPQSSIEGVLLDHLRKQPLANVKFRHRLESLQQHKDGGVAASARNLETDEVVTLEGRFLVGADGADSTVRKTLGVTMSGASSIESFTTLILRIPGLNDDLGDQQALLHFLVNPEAPCIMGPMDTNDVWFWGISAVGNKEADSETLLELVRQSIGRNYPVEVLGRDDWSAHELLAERYGGGDVFLAGDACHLHSPFGGHGVNLGIGDAVDLGWKIAGVLDGWADRTLLDSYETERKPLHQKVLETSTENANALSKQFLSSALDDDTQEGATRRSEAAEAVKQVKAPEFYPLGVVLGYRYESPVILSEKGDKPPAFSVTQYRPSTCPGSLAPHAWLPDGSSLYDHFGKGFTLLRLDQPLEDQEQDLIEAARAIGMPLTIYAPESLAVSALYRTRYALVRPDQYIAWRGESLRSPKVLLDAARGAQTAPERIISHFPWNSHQT
ncbi:FAD-dependent monooxygenase [Hoeflea sp. WL0058]|uniref:FAD-dependent monooxygenase n=1 Tax=Flavimaribacter sediminis TaxID=2865987 RepID=A0AAE2ZGB6_9HYPH|nr:FAD-dependent monooxygenase [Flavimaribacter sediminis]